MNNNRKQRALQESRERALASEAPDGVPSSRMMGATLDGRIKRQIYLGRQYYLQGLTGSHQTYEAIFALSHFFWYGDEGLGVQAYGDNDEARINAIYWHLKENHHDWCTDLRRGRDRQLLGRIRSCCTWRNKGKQDWRTGVPSPETLCERKVSPRVMKYANLKRENEARERILKALKEMIAEGEKLSVSRIALRAKASRNTVSDLLRRYRDDGGVGVGGFGLDRSLLDLDLVLDPRSSSDLIHLLQKKESLEFQKELENGRVDLPREVEALQACGHAGSSEEGCGVSEVVEGSVEHDLATGGMSGNRRVVRGKQKARVEQPVNEWKQRYLKQREEENRAFEKEREEMWARHWAAEKAKQEAAAMDKADEEDNAPPSSFARMVEKAAREYREQEALRKEKAKEYSRKVHDIRTAKGLGIWEGLKAEQETLEKLRDQIEEKFGPKPAVEDTQESSFLEVWANMNEASRALYDQPVRDAARKRGTPGNTS